MPLTREQKIELVTKKRAGTLTTEDRKLIEAFRQEKRAMMPKPSRETGADMIGGAVRSAAEGLTAGISEPVVTTIKGTVSASKQMKKEFGVSTLSELSEKIKAIPDPAQRQQALDQVKSRWIELVSAAKEADVVQRRQFKEKNPILSSVSEVGGALVPTPANVSMQLFRGARALTGAAKLTKASPLMGKVLREGTAGAAGAGAFQAVRKQALEPTGFIRPGEDPNIADVAKLGGAISTGLPIAGAVIPPVTRAVSKVTGSVAKKAMAVSLGVSEKNINKFLAAPDRINKAKSIEEIKDIVDKDLGLIKSFKEAEKFDVVDEVARGLGVLKKRVIKSSEESLDILDKSGKKFKTARFIAPLLKERNKFFIHGTTPVGEASKSAVNKIESVIANLRELPQYIDGPTAKRILQQFRKNIDFIQTPGTFSKNPAQEAFVRAQRAIDARIKNAVPAYRVKMEETFKLTNLLKDASRRFGRPEATEKAIERLGSLTIPDQILNDFFSAANINTKTLLKRLDQQRGVAGLQNSEAKIRQLMRGSNIETKRAFDRLSEITGKNFKQMIDDAQVQDSFRKEFLRGSRNVNLWGVLGMLANMATGKTGVAGATGAVIGGGLPGLAIGVVSGALIDKYGPTMAKKILDNVVKLKKVDPKKFVNDLDIPEAIKQNMRKEYVVFQLTRPRTHIDNTNALQRKRESK